MVTNVQLLAVTIVVGLVCTGSVSLAAILAILDRR